MSIDLADYENKAREAVKAFWGNREAVRQKQVESGKADQGEHAGVTAGKNMDGFLALAKDIFETQRFRRSRNMPATSGALAPRILPPHEALGHVGHQRRKARRGPGI